jgi:hypothetical protein
MSRADVSFLVLRLGFLAAASLLAGLPQAKAEASFRGAPGLLLGALVLLLAAGALGRLPAALLAAVALGTCLQGAWAGEDFLERPARALEGSILLGSLALSGPGRLTVGEAWRRFRREP